MADTYSKVTVRRIWNIEDGTRIEVGEDLDGVGLLEIRTMNNRGDREHSILFSSREEAELVIQALQDSLYSLDK